MRATTLTSSCTIAVRKGRWRLRRRVAIHLKLGRMPAADKDQMEFHLRRLDQYETLANEHSPLGQIPAPAIRLSTSNCYDRTKAVFVLLPISPNRRRESCLRRRCIKPSVRSAPAATHAKRNNLNRTYLMVWVCLRPLACSMTHRKTTALGEEWTTFHLRRQRTTTVHDKHSLRGCWLLAWLRRFRARERVAGGQGRSLERSGGCGQRGCCALRKAAVSRCSRFQART
jgi:hypothetical protein